MTKEVRIKIEEYLKTNPIDRTQFGCYVQAAKKFNTDTETIRSIYRRLRSKGDVITFGGWNKELVLAQLKREGVLLEKGNQIEDHQEDNKREITSKSTEIKTLEDLIKHCDIDLNTYEVVRHTINKWTMGEKDVFQVKAVLQQKAEGDFTQDRFINFLKEYEPAIKAVKNLSKENKNFNSSCLLINKQDAHLNRYDINGNNDIKERFNIIQGKIARIIEKAKLSTNVDEILYVVGSDEFNAEWTGMTTKFTQQSNLGNFWETFELICQHEVDIINLLLQNCNHLNITFLSGNHDEFVGWHMIKWLEAYYRNQNNLTIDTSPAYRKYIRYSNSAMMFNHGDTLKAEKLATLFPIEFKEEWSYCDNYYIFAGDKHHLLAKDLNGIQYYQLPAFTNTTSLWEDKHGHVGSKAEIVAFLIEENNGISDIYKSQL